MGIIDVTLYVYAMRIGVNDIEGKTLSARLCLLEHLGKLSFFVQRTTSLAERCLCFCVFELHTEAKSAVAAC